MDPYTDIILARETGIVSLKDFIEGETYAVEAVEGGKKQMVVVEARDRKLSPHIEICRRGWENTFRGNYFTCQGHSSC